jgi:hypothetical protein
MRIRDGKNSDPGWEKFGSGIRDKHPGNTAVILRRKQNLELNQDQNQRQKQNVKTFCMWTCLNSGVQQLIF